MNSDRRTVIAGLSAILPLGLAKPARAAIASVAAEPPLVAFARDLSGGDAAVVKAVSKLVANPPSKVLADKADRVERAWPATINVLNKANFVEAFEDKYSNEAISIWIRDRRFDPALMPRPARELWTAVEERDIGETPTEQLAFGKRLWAGYADAVAALEAAIAAKGKRLISLDWSSEDTMIFAFVTPEVADRWTGSAFGTSECFYSGFPCGVHRPMWDRYWEFLVDALSSSDEEIGEFPELPPGIAASTAPTRNP